MAVLRQEEKVIEPPSSTVPSIPLPPSPSSPRVEDQIIIKYKPGVSEQSINEHLNKYNARIIKRIDAINRLVIQVPEGQGDAILEQLKKDNLIEVAEPDYLNQAFLVPNDPDYNQQWGLSNTGQTIKGEAGSLHADINVEPAWDVTLGNGILIAVLDTGIDSNQPELSAKITGKKDFSGSGIDDGFGHGTHIAGIIAAATNNSVGTAGVCPGCNLIIGKILDDEGYGPDSAVAEGIIWAADNGAKVINMSLGGTSGQDIKCEAVKYAWDKGVIMAAAAGNFGNKTVNYPAHCENVIAVASTDNKDALSSFSTYGTWVDVAAPGSVIYSTLPISSYKLQQLKPGLKTNYDYLSGTSMSTPMVAGVVGLIWSSSYGTSATSVVQRLFETADKITGTGQNWQYGRINAGKAIVAETAALPTQSNNPTSPQGPNPSSPYISPTNFYCLSGDPCTTDVPTKPVDKQTLKSPDGQPELKSPGDSGQQPSSVPNEKIEPSSAEPSSLQKTSRKGGGGESGIIQMIMELLAKILALLQQLLGSLK